MLQNDSESSDSEEDEEEEDINDLESTLSPSEGGLSMRGRKLRLGLRLEQENPLDKSNTGYDSSGLRRAAGLSDELSGSWSGGCAPPPPPPPGAPPPPPPGAPSTKVPARARGRFARSLCFHLRVVILVTGKFCLIKWFVNSLAGW